MEDQLRAWRSGPGVDFIVAFLHECARSSKQAVAVSPQEPAEVEPAKDGTTYVVAGTAGTPRYGWTGKHETDRNFAVGKGSGTTVVGDAKTQAGPYVNELDFSVKHETVDWSQARYDD